MMCTQWNTVCWIKFLKCEEDWDPGCQVATAFAGNLRPSPIITKENEVGGHSQVYVETFDILICVNDKVTTWNHKSFGI